MDYEVFERNISSIGQHILGYLVVLLSAMSKLPFASQISCSLREKLSTSFQLFIIVERAISEIFLSQNR